MSSSHCTIFFFFYYWPISDSWDHLFSLMPLGNWLCYNGLNGVINPLTLLVSMAFKMTCHNSTKFAQILLQDMKLTHMLFKFLIWNGLSFNCLYQFNKLKVFGNSLYISHFKVASSFENYWNFFLNKMYSDIFFVLNKKKTQMISGGSRNFQKQNDEKLNKC